MKLEITLDSGRLDVNIRVENAALRAALQHELPQLDKALRDAQTGGESRLDVSDFHTEHNGDGRGGLDTPADVPAAALAGSEQSEPAAGGTAEEETWSLFGEHGRLDCLV